MDFHSFENKAISAPSWAWAWVDWWVKRKQKYGKAHLQLGLQVAYLSSAKKGCGETILMMKMVATNVLARLMLISRECFANYDG